MQNLRIRKYIQNLGFLFNTHKPSGKPNVLLFSMPRSGSTWLMELVWSQPEFKAINEPLNLKGSWLQKKSRIQGFQELYSEYARQKTVNYFKGIAEGKYHFLNPNPLRKNARFFTSRIVYKVIHGGELFINDIAQNTNSKVVYLIRHPIAVALSRRQIPRTQELTSDFVMSHFDKKEQDYAKKMMLQGNDMEVKVLTWCIQNKLALSQKNKNWLLLSYERLTCHPEEVLNALAKHVELPNLDLMIESVNIPSAVSVQSEKDSVSLMKNESIERQKLISKWRSKVSKETQQKCFDVCKNMNFEVYTINDDLPVADDIL
jgi:hypothetical protein